MGENENFIPIELLQEINPNLVFNSQTSYTF